MPYRLVPFLIRQNVVHCIFVRPRIVLRSLFLITCFIIVVYLFYKQDHDYLPRGSRISQSNGNSFVRKQFPSLMPDTIYELKKRKPSETLFLLNSTEYYLNVDIELFSKWRDSTVSFCNTAFLGYDHEFSRLRDVFISPKLAHGRRGGEPIAVVKDQSESVEYTSLDKGFFQLPCMGITARSSINYEYNLNSRNHLTRYQSSLETLPLSVDMQENDDNLLMLSNRTVFVVTRYEYANFYHSMTDFYNAYLMMVFFQLKPTDVAILLIDGHPSGGLDSLWSDLFSGIVLRVGHLEPEKPIRLRDAVFVMQSYNSPLNQHHLPSIPLTEQFRAFFLDRHGISWEPQTQLDCKRLRVLFIWRHDYVSHPRNPSGHVVRKIQNEAQLVDAARSVLPTSSQVQGVQIDSLSMIAQLQLISSTDILIGMHGAGLTHALFLPRHAALMEFYPIYWASANIHFQMMSKWRGLVYERWVNSDPRNEAANHFTRIPASVVSTLLRQVLHRMHCVEHKH